MAQKIVCAVDDTEHSKSAVALAASMAKAMGAELTLLAVNELLGGVGRGRAASYLWNNADLKAVLDSAAGEAKKAGFADAKTSSVISRDGSRAIVIFSEDNGADHIVSGGKGSFSRLMLGSVSRDVVFRAHCPVTVAR